MTTSVCYWRFIKIGVDLLSLIPSTNRLAGGSVAGLDRIVSKPETLNQSFEITVDAMVGFHGDGWTRISLHTALFNAQSDVINESIDNPTGPLCWVDDESKTTTTTGLESAGDDVVVGVTSLTTLDSAVNDYVLLINESSQIGQLAKVSGIGVNEITVDLDEDLPSGSIVLKVFMAYPGSVFQGADTGRPVEQSDDKYRFSTYWRFLAGEMPVKGASL